VAQFDEDLTALARDAQRKGRAFVPCHEVVEGLGLVGEFDQGKAPVGFHETEVAAQVLQAWGWGHSATL